MFSSSLPSGSPSSMPSSSRPCRSRSPFTLATLLATLLATSFLLGGCATSSNLKPAPASDHDSSVNAQMLSLATAVNQSLNNLQQLERGEQGPRKTTPVGLAIGGAAGPDLAPVAMPTAPQPGTALYAHHVQQVSSAKLSANRQVLSTKINLSWHGGVKELLASLATKVDYRYLLPDTSSSMSTVDLDPEVKVDLHNVTVEDALSQVASQVNHVADVDVNVANRTIQLLYK